MDKNISNSILKAGSINQADRIIDKVELSFQSYSASIGLKTSSLIGRVARYTSSSTYVLSLDSWQNLFDKPNEQSQACLDSAMARKGGRKPNTTRLIYRTSLKSRDVFRDL